MRQRLEDCKKALAGLDPATRAKFELITEWAKLRHVESGLEIVPDRLSEFLTSTCERLSLHQAQAELRKPVAEPRELSTFLTVHKSDANYLYCHLTRK